MNLNNFNLPPGMRAGQERTDWHLAEDMAEAMDRIFDLVDMRNDIEKGDAVIENRERVE